jgi:hypothetical protein
MICHHLAFLLHSAGPRRLEARWTDLAASLWQRAYPVPGRHGPLKAPCLKTLVKSGGSEARLQPCDTSQQGKGRQQRDALRIKTIVPCNGCRRGNRCCTLDRDTPYRFSAESITHGVRQWQRKLKPHTHVA